MLGPNKWRLLTIVAGILLAHAIDSPNRSAPRINDPTSQQKRTSFASLSSSKSSLLRSPSSSSLSNAPAPPTSTHLGLTIETVAPAWNSNSNNRNSFSERRLARNLYTPYKRFSNIDDVRFVQRRQTTGYRNNILDRHTTFGAFRYTAPAATAATANQAVVNTARRRSDVDVPLSPLEYANTTLTNPLNDDDDDDVAVTTSKPTTLQVIKRRKYKYIPLLNSKAPIFDVEATTLPDQEIRSRTDLNFYTDDPDEKQSDKPAEQLAQGSETLPQALALQSTYQSQVSNKIAFPAPTFDAPAKTMTQLTDLQGRRSGLTFTQQTPKFDPPFVPQSYQEDDPNHPNFQVPYSEELSAPEPTEIRTARGVHYENYPHRSSVVQFPGPSTNHNAKQYRDDVTKFGDVNGPITSMQQRQFSDYYDGLRTYENIYYSDDYRRPRTYPNRSPYYESSFNGEYSGQPLRSRLIIPYKSSRTPRVIFPSNDNLPAGLYNGENYSNNDNVVFR